jgi:tetratricopeptide (TPR) repeat protein
MNGRRSAWARFVMRALGLGLATLVLAMCPSGVGADAGGGGGGGGGGAGEKPEKPVDPDYTAGMKAVDGKQYAAAIPLFEKAVARDGNNADAYNMLAYATRKNGDPAKAIPIYEKALVIDPKHRGAHEYIGEAYLTLDNLPKAKEHLARLDKLCFFPCEQYRDLKKAVEAYEKSGGKIKPVASQ